MSQVTLAQGELEREIAAMSIYEQATMEEYEAVKEELKSAHEEVLSANEEEVRNRNRELALLNAELQRARAQTAAETAGIASEQARRYADAIVESMREPFLVLDSELRVLRANQAYYRDLGERPELTEGRLLFEVGNGQRLAAPATESRAVAR